MTSDTSNAILAIATAFLALTSVVGIFFTGYQIRIANRERRGAQRQHLYETQSDIVYGFGLLVTEIVFKVRDTFHLAVAISHYADRAQEKPDYVAQYQKQLEELRVLENALLVKASSFGYFLPDDIATAASRIVGGLRMFITITDNAQHGGQNGLQIAQKTYETLDKLVSDYHEKLVKTTRKHLGIDNLTGDIQELLGNRKVNDADKKVVSITALPSLK